MACSADYGGQGLPGVLNLPMVEMICSSNLSFGLTPGLSHGAYDALMLHGSDALKQKYVPKLVTGEWTGVMCLTEPQAGTDLGLIRTKAEPNKDGSYSITGGKIFISSGEQDMSENILHLILARLPDAPPSVKGISLFVAPKFMVGDDGSLGARNSFRCESIEHKMGIHASPTCVMNYDGATGWLVGEPHEGLKAMFTMMNAARLYVGIQGLGIGEVAYQNALAYAQERLQSRSLTGPKFPNKAADPITVHPDVRRMLLTMKAFAEGGRAFTMLTALKADLAHNHPDEDVREEADHFVQLVTPLVKSYLTDGGTQMANLAMQVYGGYGYIREYGVEQYARDARIAEIYEGTNGIQAMDLVGRKLRHNNGEYLRAFFHPADTFIEEHKSNDAMQEFIKPLAKYIGYLQQASVWMAQYGMIDPNNAGAGAVEYQRMFAQTVLAHLWASMAATCLKKREAGEGNPAFYEAKLATARFYMRRILPQNVGLLASITQGAASIMDEKVGF
jgi:alkylation response protein AidB-like acyl-CoA dehydrogenase